MLTKKQTYWLDIIQQWQKSGLSQTEFCKRNELSIKNFYAYKSFFKQRHDKPDQEHKAGTFVPLQLKETGGCATLTIRIGEVSLEVSRDIDEAWVLHWLNILTKGIAS